MIFRRQESFRYTFHQPLDCFFKIIKVDDINVNSEIGTGKILDISPSGLKMLTSLNLSPTCKKIELEVQFSLEEHVFKIPGIIQWQKKEYLKDGYSYGIKLESSEEIAKKIISDLKMLAEQKVKGKKTK